MVRKIKKVRKTKKPKRGKQIKLTAKKARRSTGVKRTAQTSSGKRSRWAIVQDSKLKAELPGKRRSKSTDNIYYEWRENRSDMHPERKGDRL